MFEAIKLPLKFSKLNIATKLTLIRIFLAPVLLVVLLSTYTGESFLAALIFGLASLTDWLDGHLARQRGEITSLGKLLDPLADKLLALAALLPLVAVGRVAAWMVAVLLGRDLLVTGLRTFGASRGVIFVSSALAKLKTSLLVVAIVLLLWNFLPAVGMAALWVAMFLSVASCIGYFHQFWFQMAQRP